MLSKPEEEYYVIIYDTEDLNSVYYSGIVSTYQKNKEPLKVYYVDLGNELNKKYAAGDNESINTTDLDNLKLKNITLVKVSNGKIVKTLTNEEDIAKELEYKDTVD